MTQEQTFSLSFEGDDICVVESYPSGPVSGVVVLVHGLGGQKNSETHIMAVEAFTAQGFATFRFDFPGHGDSLGSTENLTILKGARLVDLIAAMVESRYPESALALFGASYGGTCILASDAVKRAHAVVLRSPVSDYQGVRMRQLGPEAIAQWEQDGQIEGLISRNRRTPWAFYHEAGEIDLYVKAAGCQAPLLIVQGQDDSTVPMGDSLRLSNAWGGRCDLVQITGGDHSLSDPAHTKMLVALGNHWIAENCAN